MRDMLWERQESSRGASRNTSGPGGEPSYKRQGHADLGVHRVDRGACGTPESKVKALWNRPTPNLDPRLPQNPAEPRGADGWDVVLAQCRQAGHQSRVDICLSYVYL